MLCIRNILICGMIATLATRTGGEQRKPWPQYSLQNMPKTQFTCHDKILGGYYADAETQCQMFHVCVKVAGVGVQDFRFLCPNSTAFDQEAQICANWGDVDCDQSVLYYGSDNFDLYRLSSGFESKRAPAAEEDESTFHLQRAESGDGRRYKENRIDQKSRPDQPPNYTKRFESATRKNNQNSISNTNTKEVTTKRKIAEATKRPIASYYTPTSTSTTIDDSKHDFDDIFKGSHSSNFFANRQSGREEEFTDYLLKQKPNEFLDFNKKIDTSATGKTRVATTRIKRPLQQNLNNVNNTSTAPAASAASTKTTKKVTLQHSSYQSDFFDYNSTPGALSDKKNYNSNNLTTTAKTLLGSASKIYHGFDEYQTQAKIQPTTYNPNRSKISTTKYNELKRDKGDVGDNHSSKNFNKPTANVRKIQKFEETQQRLDKQGNAYETKHNEFNEFAKVKQPQPFKAAPPSKTFDVPLNNYIEPQYFRSRIQGNRGFTPSPAPFSVTSTTPASKTVNVSNEIKPRGFASRGRVNFKASTFDYYEAYPTTASGGKKFSTLVTKNKYPTPTTFKPSTYKKFNEQNYYQQQQQQQQYTPKPKQQLQKQLPASPSTSSTFLPTTINPYYNADEDDGQYHPELYELDFPRNRLNVPRSTTLIPLITSSTTTTSTTTTPKPFTTFQNPAIHLKSQQQTSFLKEQSALTDLSDEDELFRASPSLNFGAASINKLRADIIKAEKTSQQYNSQYNPHNTYTTTTTAKNTTPLITQYQNQNIHSSSLTATDYGGYLNTSTTTRRPLTISTTSYMPTTTTTTTTKAPRSSSKKSGKSSHKSNKKTSKRPPHADEDTSYDYAYYDTDTLSESPQQYDEYEISEFSKTQKKI